MRNNSKTKFSIFQQNPNLVYFDNARTTHTPKLVESHHKKLAVKLSKISQNAAISLLKQRMLFCKKKLALLLKCRTDELFFMPQGCTAAINYVAITLSNILKETEQANNSILISEIEHHSNYLPWLANFNNVEILKLNPTTKTIVRPTHDQLQKAALLSITAQSNVLGKIWKNNFSDLIKLIKSAKNLNTWVMLDGSQVILDPNFNLKKVPSDIFVFSAHKIHGPTNLGVLFISKQMQTILPPPEQTIDTLPLTTISDFEITLNFLKNQNISKQLSSKIILAKMLTTFLQQFKFIKIISKPRNLIITFTVFGAHSHDFCDLLYQHQVIIRAGNHCAKPLHDALGITNSCRISLGYYNDSLDVQKFKNAFLATCNFLGIE